MNHSTARPTFDNLPTEIHQRIFHFVLSSTTRYDALAPSGRAEAGRTARALLLVNKTFYAEMAHILFDHCRRLEHCRGLSTNKCKQSHLVGKRILNEFHEWIAAGMPVPLAFPTPMHFHSRPFLKFKQFQRQLTETFEVCDKYSMLLVDLVKELEDFEALEKRVRGVLAKMWSEPIGYEDSTPMLYAVCGVKRRRLG